MSHAMQLGILAIAPDGLNIARSLGCRVIELDCEGFLGNPAEGELDIHQACSLREALAADGISLSALAYYGLAQFNPSLDDLATTYRRVFAAAEALGAPVVATMGGFDASRDWSGNLDLFTERFTRLTELAEMIGLKLAIENWMGIHTRLPHRPKNIGGSPATWDELFERVASSALGIEFDPSHLHWQGIDYLRATREYASRIYHVHAKDVVDLPEERYRYGAGLDTYRWRTPGEGEIDWTRFVDVLRSTGYDGAIVIEHEDERYTGDRFDEGYRRAFAHLKPLIAE